MTILDSGKYSPQKALNKTAARFTITSMCGVSHVCLPYYIMKHGDLAFFISDGFRFNVSNFVYILEVTVLNPTAQYCHIIFICAER